MLAFKGKFTVTPDGANFRATHASGSIKFFAPADCLKSLGNVQGEADQAKLESVCASHSADLEAAAWRIIERDGHEGPRDDQGRFVLKLTDLAVA